MIYILDDKTGNDDGTKLEDAEEGEKKEEKEEKPSN
jgi:hypothetical protein